MLRLQTVQAKDRDLLWNINQKYLYEMTSYYDDPMDENGNYHYGHFDDYFLDPRRVAYFIYNDNVMVGFAMLCPYSTIGQNPDYTMAEFTIFPLFRRKHFAHEVAKMILARHPGKWEIKYNEKNGGAKKLWNIVAAPFKPEVHHLNEEETVLSFEVAGKIIAACGNDCAACPRYIAHPYEKTSEELQHTAELWMKIGYRDHIVTNEEISCTGCKLENWCRYHVVKCCQERGISTCGDCSDYPCENMKECFEVTRSFEPSCRKMCSDEEYELLKTAFFEKEKNIEHKEDEKMLETERLILRRWNENDAGDLYKYASDPDVGPIAGWPAHQSIEESRDVIKNVLGGKEAYAICLKEDGKAIGTIELMLNGHTDMTDRDDECEMGYWLGKPFWGRGIMPEAVKEMLRHAFEDCSMQKVWIGYYEGNTKSKRVQEKCGFKYQWKSENVDVPLMHEKRTEHVNLMTKEDWIWEKTQNLKFKAKVEKAGFEDIDTLVELRLDYLVEDNGSIDKKDAEKIREALPGYYRKHLNKDLFAYVIREEKTIVSCAFLLVIEKPMSPAFINGKTGTILNVYTKESYRRKGYARMIMDVLLAEAKDMGLVVMDLKSTEDGYSLYRSVGFQDDHSKYHLMKWKNQ